MALLDAWINRQPYYATYHSFWGMLFCWGYLIFNISFVMAGGDTGTNFPYIYPALNWRSAGDLSHFLTPGKMIIVEVLAFVPLFNSLYWCMLWSRRRARVAAKQSAV